MLKLIACLSLAALPFGACSSQDAEKTPEAPPAKLKVLMLDGQNNHDWRKTTVATKATLEACGRFTVDVATSPAGRDAQEEWADWNPEFAKYDVVFSNYNDGGQCLWSEKTKQDLVDYVSGGGGLVIVHAANNSSGDWLEYNKMIAVGGWGGRTPQHGSHLRRVDGKWTTDPAPTEVSGSHGRQLEFVVESAGVPHPILEGVPDRWMHSTDELYDSLRGPCENVTVLASAYAPRSKRHEPVIMTIAYGEGRVFHTPLGHVGSDVPVHCVGFQTIVARGTEWAATGAVTLPVPKGFPGEDKISVIPPAKVVWKAE